MCVYFRVYFSIFQKNTTTLKLSKSMKALLKSDLQAIADKIKSLPEDALVSELQNCAKELYEKLTVLRFVEDNLKEVTPLTKTPSNENLVKNKIESDLITKVEFDDSSILSTLDEDLFVSEEGMEEHVLESATEKMIDIVAQMDPEGQQVDDLIEKIVTKTSVGKSEKDIVTPQQTDIDFSLNKPASLNDRLKKGINIGLNDRIAFVKHLFNGSTEDFNRVVSQLNTSSSELEALEFLNNMVKPEYNNWIGKEEYEQRLLSFLEGKFS